ncbi:large-conductance mechanosensitive channel [Mortierella sp. GBAus27b]|nr:hypothetical protein BGX31_011403 [Mortierella sp. GBA43]KAI8349712.1 large-conductance mechanosensitive channel [Mortierella sp. GBAus27b]
MSGIRDKVKNSGVWHSFVEFISQGNVLDLGIGIVIGGAFSKVTSSFVDDILTPPLGLLISGSNLENWFIVIRQGNTPNKQYQTVDEAQQDGAVTENVGRFLQTSINFILVALTLFLIIYSVKRVRELRAKRHAARQGGGITKPEPAEASHTTQTCPWCGSNVPVTAVKCMYCTSYVNEKVPAELLNKQPQNALIELEG